MSLVRCLVFADPAFVSRITPPPLFEVPDHLMVEQYDLDWEGVPPIVLFDPADNIVTEQYDLNWDDVP